MKLLALLLSILFLSTTPLTPLSSKSRGCILLTFDGFESKGDAWGHQVWAPSRMTDREKSIMKTHLRDYFSGWDVLVTENQDRFYNFPDSLRIRCVVTLTPLPSSDRLYGISWMNSVLRKDSSAALVNPFEAEYNPYFLAVVAAHEIGHTLGLDHALEDFGYWKQIERGDFSAGPIMGHPYPGARAYWRPSDSTTISKTWRLK